MGTGAPVRPPRRALPLAAPLALVAAGLLLALAGLAAMTVARPSATVTATASVRSGAPVVLTAPGVLESRDGPVTVRARGQGRVVLAVGRERDVTAWAGDAARTTVTRLSSASVLATRDRPGAPTTPDPAGSDLWVQQATGSGGAALTYRARPGSWVVLAAAEGAAPRSLSLGWREHRAPAWALPALVAGAVVLAAGAVLLLRGRRGPATPEAAAPATAPATAQATAPAGTAVEDAR